MLLCASQVELVNTVKETYGLRDKRGENIVCIGISTPLSKTSPLFYAKPPIKSTNCPSPPPSFLGNPPIYWFLVTPPL